MTLGAALSESAIARAVLPWRCFGSRELTLGAAPAKKARFQLLLRVTVFRSTRWGGLWGQAVEAASLQTVRVRPDGARSSRSCCRCLFLSTVGQLDWMASKGPFNSNASILQSYAVWP